MPQTANTENINSSPSARDVEYQISPKLQNTFASLAKKDSPFQSKNLDPQSYIKVSN